MLPMQLLSCIVQRFAWFLLLISILLHRLYTALSMSDELRMDWELQPGDLQLLHNCSTCHTRQSFVNGNVSQYNPSNAAPLCLCLPTGAVMHAPD